MRTTNITDNLQTWSTKLIRASQKFFKTLYTKVQNFIAKLDEADDAQGWTTEQLINMSESMAQAYCPGLGKFTQLPSPEPKKDQWDLEKQVQLGQSLTDGFGQTVIQP